MKWMQLQEKKQILSYLNKIVIFQTVKNKKDSSASYCHAQSEEPFVFVFISASDSRNTYRSRADGFPLCGSCC